MFYCWQAHFPPTDSKTVWLEELVFNFEDMLLLSRRFLLNSMDKKKKKKRKTVEVFINVFFFRKPRQRFYLAISFKQQSLKTIWDLCFPGTYAVLLTMGFEMTRGLFHFELLQSNFCEIGFIGFVIIWFSFLYFSYIGPQAEMSVSVTWEAMRIRIYTIERGLLYS